MPTCSRCGFLGLPLSCCCLASAKSTLTRKGYEGMRKGVERCLRNAHLLKVCLAWLCNVRVLSCCKLLHALHKRKGCEGMRKDVERCLRNAHLLKVR